MKRQSDSALVGAPARERLRILIKDLAKKQIEREKMQEDMAKKVAKDHSENIVHEAARLASAAPSSYNGKHAIQHAVDHASILNSKVFTAEDEICDAALWHSLLQAATFIDSHVDENVIRHNLALSLEDDRKLTYYDPRGVNVSVVHPTSGARELINEKWLSDGVLEASAASLSSDEHFAWT